MRIPYTLLPSDTPLGKSFISKVPMVLLEFSEFYQKYSYFELEVC